VESEILRVIPLGGLGEIGKNMLVLEAEGKLLVIDAGLMFPSDDLPGIDLVIPDFAYLINNQSKFKGFILTHGHEDHIGALAYILKKFNVPVYSSRFTLSLAEKRLAEFEMLGDVLLHRVTAGQTVDIGPFAIEFIHASHSLVECFSLAVKTPVGTIIHTGDYKIDDTPVIGRPYDLARLKEIGDAGVLALLCDSTNATVPGRTPSEQAVIPAFEEIFEETEGRLFIATFSSSLHRLQIIFDVAHEFGRRVCVLGRSMQRNVEIAASQGLLKIPHDTLIELSDARAFDDDEVCYLVTGSQGEMRAALWNLATQVYKGMQIEKGDTVVLSARIIPGNEKNISRLIGHLYKRGANIIEEKRRLVHVSGHASQEDIRIMVETSQPRFVIPIHGEYRMLFRQKEFIKNHIAGFDDENIILVENGDLIEIDERSVSVVEKIDLFKTFIDEESMEEIEYETVRERKKLAYGGAASLVVTIDKKTHDLVGEPILDFQGVAGIDPLNGLASQAREAVVRAISDMKREHIVDRTMFREQLRLSLKKYLQNELGTKPVIVTTIVEV